MTKKFTSLLIGFVLFGFTASNAQLAGIYTIGGTTPDYTTIIDAATALTSQGVSAPVTFNIRDGIYTGKVVLTAITGASASNTITFQSENADSTLVTISVPSVSSGAANYAVFFNGVDYVTFKQLTIERTGTSISSRVIELAAGADYNTISNCILTNEATTATGNFNVIIYSGLGSVDNFNVFSNNKIINGSYAFYFFGGSATILENGNTIAGNTFSNQTVSAIQIANETDLIISGNNITGTTATYLTGILSTNCKGNTNVLANKINLTNGGTGISVQQCNGLAGEVIVANNFVTINTVVNTTNTQAFGIKLSDCNKTGIYYNNVLNLADFTAQSCFAFQATGTGSNVFVYNNIFDAAFSYVVGAASTAVTQMNYNDLYSYGFFFGLFNGSINLGNLTDWQAGTTYDANSVSVDPLFVSNTDLHVLTFALNGLAIPVIGVTTDIDGQPRDPNTPDIGADETNPPSNDVGVTKLLSPLSGACGDLNQTVSAIVRNYAAVPQSNITVIAEVSGTQTLTLTGTIAGPIGVYQSDTVYFTPTLNTGLGDSLTIKLYTTILNDEDNSNDTLTVDSIYINVIPAPPVVPSNASTCLNSPANVTAILQTSQQVYWYTNPTGGLAIQTGNPLTVSPITTTTYYAEARDTTTSGAIVNDSLYTANTQGNGSSAIFFDVTNLSNSTVTVHYLSTLISGVNSASVYYLPGGLTSCTTNPVIANFTLSGSAVVNGLGSTGANYTQVPVDMNVLIPAGQTFAFCISSTTINYQNGTATATCPVFASNSTIAIHEGFGGTTATPIANRRLCGAVTYSIGTACASERVPVTIDVLPLPQVNLGNDTTIALPNVITLDAGLGFTSYLWSNGATTQTIIVAASGSYIVTVTDINGCQNTDIIIVTVLTGINDFGANSSIAIVPNPAKDFIKVALNNFVNDKYSVSLINNLGQLVLTSTIEVHSSNAEQTIDLTNVERGIYYIEIKNKKGVSHNRILVQ